MLPKDSTAHSSPESSSSSSHKSSETLPVRKQPHGEQSEAPRPHKPQLKFVNSTNPSQLRTQHYRKLVKQHAMLDAQKRRREAVQADIAKRRAQQALKPVDSGLVKEESGSPLPATLDYYEYNPSGEPEPLALTIQRFTGVSSIDPFCSLPQYSNELVDAERLQHLTVAYFPSLKRSKQYVNTLTSSPIVFLADAHPGIILQDALDENPNGGLMTMAARGEIYTLLNKRLRHTDPLKQLAPDVIAGVFNLILLELSYGDLKAINTHLLGLRRMMNIIGGSRKAGFDPNLATMAVYQGLVTAIYFEVPPERVYLKLSAEIKTSDMGQNLSPINWESPINGDEFVRTASNDKCSESSLWILRSMRTLTKRFLHARFKEETSLINNGPAAEMYNNLLKMPSSSVPFLPTTDDYVYECIRIIAIFWATAIVHNVPLSIAVSVAAARMTGTPQPVDALVRALKKSGTTDCWGYGMIGNFMWVCKTGCAAVSSGSIPFKWLYLEQARAVIHGLRNRLYRELLEACETVLQVQEGLRLPTTPFT